VSSYSEEYLRKLREFDRLIRYAAFRYRIPGVLDSEDLYQEGLIILDKMFRKYNFHPDSDDFRKMFKTELWHGLWHVLQKYKQSKRDWRRVLNKDLSTLELASDEESGNLHSDALHAFASSPEDHVRETQTNESLSLFLDTLVARLDDEARVVLSELLYPRSWSEIPEESKKNSSDDIYWRCPKKRIPRHILASILGFPKIRVRRAIKRIRSAALEVSTELGTDLVSKAGLRWLESRKKRRNEQKRSKNCAENLSSSSILQSSASEDCGFIGRIDLTIKLESIFPKKGIECS